MKTNFFAVCLLFALVGCDVGGIRGNDYSIALVSLVSGALSVYSVRDMKNRTQIFRSLGFIFLGYGLSIVALALCCSATSFSQTVDPSLFAGLKWRLIGPFRAGRVSAGAIDPVNPHTFYLGTPNGGVWKTIDVRRAQVPPVPAAPSTTVPAR